MRHASVQRFFNGPGAGLDTIGGMVVFEIGGYLIVMVALLAIVSVVRHSRAAEAAGIAELVRAGGVGRHAVGTSAALVSREFADAGGLVDMSAIFGAAPDPVAGLVQFSSLLLAILGAAAGVAALGAAGREESSGRLEAICAGKVSRGRWATYVASGAMATTGLGVILAGGCLSLGVRLAGLDKPWWDLVAPLVAYVPAACLVVAIAIALFGWRAHAGPAAWLLVAYAAIAGLFGTVLRLPRWAIDLSPFAHAPRPPDEALLGAPVGVAAALVLAVAVLGVVLFRRRDIGH